MAGDFSSRAGLETAACGFHLFHERGAGSVGPEYQTVAGPHLTDLARFPGGFAGACEDEPFVFETPGSHDIEQNQNRQR